MLDFDQTPERVALRPHIGNLSGGNGAFIAYGALEITAAQLQISLGAADPLRHLGCPALPIQILIPVALHAGAGRHRDRHNVILAGKVGMHRSQGAGHEPVALIEPLREAMEPGAGITSVLNHVDDGREVGNIGSFRRLIQV
ncbi:MAG: hypothetical protein HN333_11170, partial [Rhodospirillaceae bacterium]|nr:hypothetical protein [Rhodospirillaceae bacterium]